MPCVVRKSLRIFRCCLFSPICDFFDARVPWILPSSLEEAFSLSLLFPSDYMPLNDFFVLSRHRPEALFMRKPLGPHILPPPPQRIVSLLELQLGGRCFQRGSFNESVTNTAWSRSERDHPFPLCQTFLSVDVEILAR